MKIGDYVRYKKLIYHNQGVDDIRISKIKDIEDAIETGYNQIFIFFENGNGEYEDRIIKSSPNIIDLTEVGDYVNGHKVLDIAQAPEKVLYLNDISQKCALIPVCDYQIKSIVTKEQFESIKYEVK